MTLSPGTPEVAHVGRFKSQHDDQNDRNTGPLCSASIASSARSSSYTIPKPTRRTNVSLPAAIWLTTIGCNWRCASSFGLPLPNAPVFPLQDKAFGSPSSPGRRYTFGREWFTWVGRCLLDMLEESANSGRREDSQVLLSWDEGGTEHELTGTSLRTWMFKK